MRLLLTLMSAAAVAAPVGFGLLTVSSVSAQTSPSSTPSAPAPSQVQTQSHSGTAASLRRYIDSLEVGKPNYDEMSLQLAEVVRQELPQIEEIIRRMGTFQSMVFQDVDRNGMDVYHVTFQHGQIEWRIAPLSSQGKVERRGFRELP
jgi:hypothetical protein